MKTSPSSLLLGGVAILMLAWLACPGHARPLAIAANTASPTYDPANGVVYLEMRTHLLGDFPGSTFTRLPLLTGDLSRFDLIILNRFSSQDLQPNEQAAIHDYVLGGGNLLFVGEAIGPPNDTFTLPFGIVMTPDPATQIALAFASYTNPAHRFLNGPFGVPSAPPSGSFAAKVVTLGPSVELARWTGGGVAIAAFDRNTLAPGAGFGLFVTDINMMTPNRYSQEVGPVLSNALSPPPPPVPVLGIAPVTGGVELTWGTEAIGWILQASGDLDSWSDIGTAIVAAGSHVEVPGGLSGFFRLRK